MAEHGEDRVELADVERDEVAEGQQDEEPEVGQRPAEPMTADDADEHGTRDDERAGDRLDRQVDELEADERRHRRRRFKGHP